jgi:acetylornithine deacetylase/succinyl-diaminopimelate desuccinylase-like protein
MDETRSWLDSNYPDLKDKLAGLVGIRSISTDADHNAELRAAADAVCDLMRWAGLSDVELLRDEGPAPYAYGEWLGAPGRPTIFLYSHNDVQPANYEDQWLSPPWVLTERDGRLYGRGGADDKGGCMAQLAAIAAFLKTRGELPVNVKVLVEGAEESGSSHLLGFLGRHRDRLLADVIVVTDTANIDTGIPSVTYSLRGALSFLLEVRAAEGPVHSGLAGGALADAALALNVLLARLYWDHGRLPIPGLYDSVRPLTEAERETIRRLPWDEGTLRRDFGVLPDVHLAMPRDYHFYEQTWRMPAVTVLAQEASSVKGASNQVLSKASAVVSCRLVPDQDPQAIFEALRELLTRDPPWNVEVSVTSRDRPAAAWMTDPTGPAFEAALDGLRSGFGQEPIPIGSGGTIPFVGPLADLFNGAPAILLGIDDPKSNLHAPNESLHEGDWRKLMASLTYVFENLGRLPADKIR